MKKTALIILFFCFLLPCECFAGWLAGETQRIKLTLDHTKAGAADLTDFPVTVFLNANNWNFSQCDFSGRNIRVTSSDGVTLLKYDRDYYDSAGETGILHVKVPTYSCTLNTVLYVYSHPSTTSDSVDGEDVANTWVGYDGIYHFSYPLYKAAEEWNALKSDTPRLEGQADDGYIISEPSYWYDEETNLWKLWIRSEGGLDTSCLKYLWATEHDGFNWTNATDCIVSGYQQPHVLINDDDAWHTPMEYAIIDDGGSYTDYTTDANDADVNDVALLPASPAVNDAFYFGGKNKSNFLVLNVGTAGVGTWTLAWEYYNGASWESLSNVVDGTEGFTVVGENKVRYTLPTDWAEATINSSESYYIRARVSSYTSITTQPLATKAQIHQKFWLYQSRVMTGCNRCQEDLHTSANETDFILDTADIIDFTSGGKQFGNFGVWQEGTNGYAIGDQLDQLVYNWVDFYYTTTDGRTWSSPVAITAPIASWGDVVVGPKIGDYYYALGHGGNGKSGIPSDIYLYRSTNKISWGLFGSWGATAPFSGKVLWRSLDWECPLSANSQIADVWLFNGLNTNTLYINYDVYCNQGPYSVYNTIKEGVAVIPYSFEDYVYSMYQLENKKEPTWAITNNSVTAGAQKIGSSAAFGATAYLNLGDRFDIGGGSYTIEFLIKTEASTNYQNIAFKRKDTVPYSWPFYIAILPSTNANANKIVFETRDATEIDQLVSGQTVTSNDWQYVACVRNFAVGKHLIVDGNAAATSSGNAGDTIADNAINTTIGMYASSLLGGLDELRISTVARSDDWCHATNYSLNDQIITYSSGVDSVVIQPVQY